MQRAQLPGQKDQRPVYIMNGNPTIHQKPGYSRD